MQILMDASFYSFASDTNECDLGTHNCNRNARCTNTIGSFECHCYPGYEGNGIECTGRITTMVDTLEMNVLAQVYSPCHFCGVYAFQS